MKYRFAICMLAAGLFVLTGQESVAPRVFTSAQAEAGRVAYESTCGKCHTPTLVGRKSKDSGELPAFGSLSKAYQEFIAQSGYVAPLAGKEFLAHWGSKTVAELVARFDEAVRPFPPEGTNGETSVNLTAYVLQVNGAKAGRQPLTRSTAVAVNSTIQ